MKLIILAALCALAQGKTRVVGGNDATIEAHPWQVSLQYTGRHFCGGSLVSSNHVLTAAHCKVYDITKTTVVAGVTDNTDLASAQVRHLASFVIDPNYNPSTIRNDFAIITLEKKVDINSKVNIVNLPAPNSEPDRQLTTTTSGWGLTKVKLAVQNGSLEKEYITTDILQSTIIQLQNDSYCRQFWSYVYTGRVMVCAGGGTDRVSSCMGDSGGPLTQVIDGVTTIIGIVSWGSSLCGTLLPSTYAQVSAGMDFINKAMAGEL